jgi:large conductance mechanosensitive channel
VGFFIFEQNTKHMKLLKEFKDFAVKGNMMDMAIGIIIGASFNAIVNVLVKNIILPPISLLSDGISFEEKKIILREASNEAAQVSIDYGLLIETVLDFLIVGFTIFIVVKFINKLKNQANDVEDTTVPTPVDIELLSKIKELLEAQNEALIKK